MSAQITQVASVDEAEQLAAFLNSVWSDGAEVAPFDLIVAAIHVGAYAVVARQDQKIVGGSFGFIGQFEQSTILHSHVTAANVPGVGFIIKQHQKLWAAQQGLAAITWTFDPLVRRNCVFNFEKLGATAVEFLPNFYGAMTDSINAGDESDRLFAFWPTDPSTKPTAPVGRKVEIELPEDIESLRKSDLAGALEWRRQIREILQPAFAAGATISSMTADRKAIVLQTPEAR
jgi:predicted GNAT superfamily acetyltransferase